MLCLWIRTKKYKHSNFPHIYRQIWYNTDENPREVCVCVHVMCMCVHMEIKKWFQNEYGNEKGQNDQGTSEEQWQSWSTYTTRHWEPL
jgi:hypothetical protein